MLSEDMRIAGFDDELWAAMAGEARRREACLELIAAENYARSDFCARIPAYG
jgi:glycine hydroxymethyltransferase